MGETDGRIRQIPDALPAIARGRPLPAQLTQFVGRRDEIKRIRQLLRDSRLVTLVGTGGCGKTRLALRIAEEPHTQIKDGVYWVDLAPLVEAHSVPAALLASLGLREEPARSHFDTVLRYLRDRSVLIIFDNCEHLLPACAELAEPLLAGSAGLRLLATSREPIGINGEVVWRVPSLPTPDPADPTSLAGLREFDAVRLFLDRAAAAAPSFRLVATNADAVAEICTRLDGIPLAIELAAARVAAFTPQQIAGELDDCLAILAGPDRRTPARHRTLHASIDWSHGLLDEREAMLFRRLAVFVGAFSFDAVRSVACGKPLGQTGVLDLLTRLAAKSLVTVSPVSVEAGELGHRYRLLETVRQYAVERLNESGETDQVRDQHLEHAITLVERVAAQPAQNLADGLDLLESELANLRAALDWAIRIGEGDLALRLVGGMTDFFFIRARVSDGRRWFADALAASDPAPSPQRARVLWGTAHLGMHTATVVNSRELAREALAMARDLGDRQTAARALTTLGAFDLPTQPRQALVHLNEAADIAADSGDGWCRGVARGLAVMSCLMSGDIEQAGRYLAEPGASQEQRGEPYARAWRLLQSAQVALRGADLVTAEAAIDAARAIAADLRDVMCLAWAAPIYAEIACWRGRARQAQHVLAQCDAEWDLSGHTLNRIATLMHAALGRTALALGDLTAAEPHLRAGLAVPAWGVNHALLDLAEVALLRGHGAQARDLATQAVQQGSVTANMWLLSAAKVLLAQVTQADGDPAGARNLYHEALQLQRDNSYRLDAVVTLEAIARLQAEHGSIVDAARLFAAVTSARQRLGIGPRPIDIPRHRRDRARLTEALDAATLRDARREGAVLTLDEAIAYACRGRGRRTRPANGWQSLTPTETALARLVAQGLTNQDIAKQLFVSPATVKTHLRHVFRKLDISRRADLAAQAARVLPG